jgi:hypothetical protein
MSIAVTVLQDAIITLNVDNTFNKFEGRSPEFGTFQAFKDGSDLLLPSGQVTALRTAARRPEKIISLNRYTATTHTTYTCDFNPDENTSAFTPITWVTIGFDAAITPAVNEDNYVTAAEDLKNQMVQGLRTVYSALEADAAAFLETNKSATNDYPIETQIPGGTDTAGVQSLPYVNRQQIYQIMPAVFTRNLLTYGKITDVANSEAITNFQFIQAQGAGNAVNAAYQVQPGIFDEYRSNFVGDVADADIMETHFFFPKGSVGVYNWVPFEGRTNKRISEGEGWTTMIDPVMGMEWQVHWKYECVAGQYVMNFSYTGSFAFMRAYSSDNSVTPILKYEVQAQA